jgi:NitT/TauT family transport system ATP-binding protein
MNYQSPNGEITALTNINLAISKGEFICIVGPSGCGKSTLLSIIAGLLKPSQGSIIINGRCIAETGMEVGYMLQKDYLF